MNIILRLWYRSDRNYKLWKRDGFLSKKLFFEKFKFLTNYYKFLTVSRAMKTQIISITILCNKKLVLPFFCLLLILLIQ